MEDIRSVLSQFHSKKKRETASVQRSVPGPGNGPQTSEIPDLFFDHILRTYKLNRQEISLLMYLYRQVWCRPNLYKDHGIGPLNSYNELATALGLSVEELGQHLRALENYGFVETVRAGQYFVRKYFTEEFDLRYGQHYNDFF